MANKPIDMKKLRAALRLHHKGYSKRSVAQSCGISRNTLQKYIRLYKRLNIPWEDLEQLDDKALNNVFIQTEAQAGNPRLEQLHAYFPYVHKELRKTGVTRKLLWEEYRQRHADGYMMTQFCEHYNRWCRRVSPVMHVEYKAGDKVLVDYSGKKLRLVDAQSGEEQEVEVFVAILGASHLIYVEAVESQQKADFIQCCENALHYFGGVPKAIVTDNLKSAVTKSHRYEPRLNADFADFAEHYELAVLPTRAYKPKDKALVEGAVRIVYQQVHARIRSRMFHSLKALNATIRSLLEQINGRKLSGRPYSRREFFEAVEAGALAPLPVERFEIRNYIQATVLQNGHVSLKEDKHYYSVPYPYIRKKVRLAYTSKQVKVYYRYDCIATHVRTKSPYNYTTDPDHLASTHKQYTKWNAQYFIKWAASIDKDVQLLIERILEKKQHPEQAYRSCIGVLSLHKRVGQQRFVKACALSLLLERYSYASVLHILERGMDKLAPVQESNTPLPTHDNIRGKTYYTTNNSNDDE